MKEIELISGKYLLVEVPEDATDFVIDHGGYLLMSVPGSEYTTDQYYPDNWKPGNWQIIGKANELTSNQWKEIVQSYGKMFMDYESKLNGLAAHSLTEIQSGHSLIKSHSMNPQTTLILKLQQ